MSLRAALLSLVGLAAIATAIVGAGAFWRWRYPVATDYDRERMHRRVATFDARRRSTEVRDPLREPAIEGDGAQMIAAVFPQDYPTLEKLRNAWSAAMNDRPFDREQRQILEALRPHLPTVRRALNTRRRDWFDGRIDATAGRVAAEALTLLAIEESNRTGASCLDDALAGFQLRIELHEVDAPAIWMFERCARLGSPAERRRAAGVVERILDQESHPALDVEAGILREVETWVDPPRPFIAEAAYDWWVQRKAYSASLAEARAILDHGTAKLDVLDDACMPGCGRILSADPTLWNVERAQLHLAGIYFAHKATVPRLLAAMLAIGGGEPETEVRTRLPDPYDGAPLRMTTVRDRRAIYSVGFDQRDDHGQGDDIVVRLPP